MTALAFPYLTTLVLLPAVGAGVVALIPRSAVAAWFHEAVGVGVTVLTLAVAAAVLFAFKSGTGAYQMVSTPVCDLWMKAIDTMPTNRKAEPAKV